MLKKLQNKIYARAGIVSDRTKNITRHVILSFVYKGGSILASFLMVPVIINYLDTDNYGVWLTLSSFIAWFSFFDIGLGNGLRNKFTEAKAKGDLHLAKAYVSSAYFTISAICLGLISLFLLANFFVDWTRVFNTHSSLRSELSLLMPIVFVFFCMQLVAKLIITIYTANLSHSIQSKVTFFTQVISLAAIWLLTFTPRSSLLVFGTIYSLIPILLLIVLNIIGFQGEFRFLRPTISLWKKSYTSDIFSLGVKFFFIQLSGIILFTTDNIIIAQLFEPGDVVPYNIAYQYFSISNMIFSIIVFPYWSSITDAYAKNDFTWIKTSMRNLSRISLSFIVLLFLMIVVSPFVYKIWVGNKVTVPLTLSIFMSIYFSLTIFYSPFTSFINGTGKLSLQLYTIAISAILNIPLSIFLAKNLNLQVAGIIIATSICILPHVILSPIQYSKIINRTANGIWYR